MVSTIRSTLGARRHYTNLFESSLEVPVRLATIDLKWVFGSLSKSSCDLPNESVSLWTPFFMVLVLFVDNN